MLKPLNQPRSSPVSASSSPRFHQYQYGPSSPRTTSSTAPRRNSLVPAPKPAPPRQVVHYVDRGTQYSPMLQKMNNHIPPPEPPLPKLAQIQQPQIPASQIAHARPPSPSKPVLEAGSPSMKKRHNQDESLSAISSTSALPPKRVRSDQLSIKVLPAKYELCEVEDMVVLIANMISELIETNDSLPLQSGVLTRFHSRTPPGISVKDYLQRLAKHATLTPPLLLSMVYYIDRLCSLYPAFTITTLTVHRFLITAATVAAKGLSDSFWNNATYARVGGIKIAELGLLELDFLYRVDWKIVPNPEVLVDYYRGLVDRADDYELEDEGSSIDEDDEGDEGENVPSDTPETTATDAKWKEWMDDVSTKKSDKAVDHKKS